MLEGPYYHTISATRGRRPIFADPVNARLLIETIQFMRRVGRAYVLAYAVMPDHLHLLAVPRGDTSISDVMKDIKGYTAKRVNTLAGRKGPIWQQGFYDRVIRDEEQLRVTVEYIHTNPVEEGRANDVRDYEYSSAHPNARTDIEAYFSP